nr:hypothetical protein [Candidatus Sigynarchaeota archaeon]
PHCIIALMGGTWEKDYKDANPDGYSLHVVKEDDAGMDGGHRVFVKSGGRDNPIPVTLKQNSSGEWKITNGMGTIVMDVRKTKTQVEDF